MWLLRESHQPETKSGFRGPNSRGPQILGGLCLVKWLKQCHKPPIWEEFIYIYIPPAKMVMTGGLLIIVLTTLLTI